MNNIVGIYECIPNKILFVNKFNQYIKIINQF